MRPFGRGWDRFGAGAPGRPDGSLAAALACWLLGCAVVYAALFGTGYALYGRLSAALALGAVSVACGAALFRLLPRVGFEPPQPRASRPSASP